MFCEPMNFSKRACMARIEAACMRHQSNQWEGRRLCRTFCATRRRRQACFVCWSARRACEGIGCAHMEHTEELPACDVAEASGAFSVTGEGSGGKAGDQAGSASPGVAERAACVRRSE